MLILNEYTNIGYRFSWYIYSFQKHVLLRVIPFMAIQVKLERHIQHFQKQCWNAQKVPCQFIIMLADLKQNKRIMSMFKS